MPNQHIVITHMIVCWIKWVKNLNIILNQKKECGKNFIICQYMRSTNIPDMINAQTSEYQPCQLLQEMPLYSNSNKPTEVVRALQFSSPTGKVQLLPMTDQGQLTQPKIGADKETLRLTYPL